MPLLDHFHPPLKLTRHWHAFHNAWATYLASDLNHRLPPRYFAEANVQFGIEIDVAAFEESKSSGAAGPPAIQTVTKPATWTPAAPAQSIPFSTMGDIVEVAIYDSSGGPELAAAIEIVSPSNKDREENRDAFAAKCLTYLKKGVGLVIVDVVSDRGANLHDLLMARIRGGNPGPLSADLYTAAYHVVDREGSTELDVWANPFQLGQPMPTMPLWIRGGICIPLYLEATYMHTCGEYRIGGPNAGTVAR